MLETFIWAYKLRVLKLYWKRSTGNWLKGSLIKSSLIHATILFVKKIFECQKAKQTILTICLQKNSIREDWKDQDTHLLKTYYLFSQLKQWHMKAVFRLITLSSIFTYGSQLPDASFDKNHNYFFSLVISWSWKIKVAKYFINELLLIHMNKDPKFILLEFIHVPNFNIIFLLWNRLSQ